MAFLALSGCRQASFIVLEVQGDFRIPDAMNAMTISLLPLGGGDALSSFDLDLTQMGHQLPLEVGIEPKDTTPAAMEADVSAALDGVVVAVSRSEFSWVPDGVTHVVLSPLGPP